jgi:hypothetical protein
MESPRLRATRVANVKPRGHGHGPGPAVDQGRLAADGDDAASSERDRWPGRVTAAQGSPRTSDGKVLTPPERLMPSAFAITSGGRTGDIGVGAMFGPGARATHPAGDDGTEEAAPTVPGATWFVGWAVAMAAALRPATKATTASRCAMERSFLQAARRPPCWKRASRVP